MGNTITAFATIHSKIIPFNLNFKPKWTIEIDLRFKKSKYDFDPNVQSRIM